jgi:hypothetical protein
MCGSRTQVIPGYTDFSQKIPCEVLQDYILEGRLKSPLVKQMSISRYFLCARVWYDTRRDMEYDMHLGCPQFLDTRAHVFLRRPRYGFSTVVGDTAQEPATNETDRDSNRPRLLLSRRYIGQ